MGFSLRGRFHRHRDLENALIELSRDVSTIRLEIATMRGKLAVGVREKNKKNNLDAEIRSIEAQLGGTAVAYTEPDGTLKFPETASEGD